jgi:hypothetical protein
MDFHPAEPTGSRGLHGGVVAEGGNVDAVLPGHIQIGPVISPLTPWSLLYFVSTKFYQSMKSFNS